MRNLLSATEQARNKRLKELFNERQNKTNVPQPPPITNTCFLTYEELDRVKQLVKEGMRRDEAVGKVLNNL
jgi:hypothetical protein